MASMRGLLSTMQSLLGWGAAASRERDDDSEEDGDAEISSDVEGPWRMGGGNWQPDGETMLRPPRRMRKIATMHERMQGAQLSGRGFGAFDEVRTGDICLFCERERSLFVFGRCMHWSARRIRENRSNSPSAHTPVAISSLSLAYPHPITTHTNTRISCARTYTHTPGRTLTHSHTHAHAHTHGHPHSSHLLCEES